tara:strand:+ start:12 stop:197 length:186 start_codon:yes stop_codon:yes gene_type:complete
VDLKDDRSNRARSVRAKATLCVYWRKEILNILLTLMVFGNESVFGRTCLKWKIIALNMLSP